MSEKQILKINENQLKQIVAESVKKVLKEDFNLDQYNKLVQDAYDKVNEATDLIREASRLVEKEGSYHIGYLNKAYKALGVADSALVSANAKRPRISNGYIEQEYDG